MSKSCLKFIWDEAKLAYLREHIGDMTYDEIAAGLGISATTVGLKARELGLNRPIGGRRVVWTGVMVAYLRDHYSDVSASDIADHLHISPSLVTRKARELGLAKSASWNRNQYHKRYVNGYKHVEGGYGTC